MGIWRRQAFNSGWHYSLTISRLDIACRYGGEEFALFLPESSPENTYRRLRSSGEISKMEVYYQRSHYRKSPYRWLFLRIRKTEINRRTYTECRLALYQANKKAGTGIYAHQTIISSLLGCWLNKWFLFDIFQVK